MWLFYCAVSIVRAQQKKLSIVSEKFVVKVQTPKILWYLTFFCSCHKQHDVIPQWRLFSTTGSSCWRVTSFYPTRLGSLLESTCARFPCTDMGIYQRNTVSKPVHAGKLVYLLLGSVKDIPESNSAKKYMQGLGEWTYKINVNHLTWGGIMYNFFPLHL